MSWLKEITVFFELPFAMFLSVYSVFYWKIPLEKSVLTLTTQNSRFSFIRGTSKVSIILKNIFKALERSITCVRTTKKHFIKENFNLLLHDLVLRWQMFYQIHFIQFLHLSIFLPHMCIVHKNFTEQHFPNRIAIPSTVP